MVFPSFKIKNPKLKIILKPDAEIGQKGVFCKGLILSPCRHTAGRSKHLKLFH